MASYDVKSVIRITDSAGKEVPGGETHVWRGLNKVEVVQIEKQMVNYLKVLADAAEKRVKGLMVEPEPTGPSDLTAYTVCTIEKDGKLWAETTFTLPNQNPTYVSIMSYIFAQSVSKIGKKINAKLTVG